MAQQNCPICKRDKRELKSYYPAVEGYAAINLLCAYHQGSQIFDIFQLFDIPDFIDQHLGRVVP